MQRERLWASRIWENESNSGFIVEAIAWSDVTRIVRALKWVRIEAKVSWPRFCGVLKFVSMERGEEIAELKRFFDTLIVLTDQLTFNADATTHINSRSKWNLSSIQRNRIMEFKMKRWGYAGLLKHCTHAMKWLCAAECAVSIWIHLQD